MKSITMFHDATIVKKACEEFAVNMHNSEERSAVKEGVLDRLLDMMHENNVNGIDSCPYSGGVLRAAWKAGYVAASRCQMLGRGIIKED